MRLHDGLNDNLSPLTLSLSRQLSGLISRDEFFATLFILGCLNGLGSHAFVTCVTISQWLSHRWSLKDLSWCFLAAVSVIAINVIRISLMGLSEMHYQAIHNHWADTIANVIIVGLTIGCCLLGSKRELFSHV
jgi:hypothetical protein